MSQAFGDPNHRARSIRRALSLANRLTQVARHLGFERAHFAGCMFSDLCEFLAARPECVASLTLVGFSPPEVTAVTPFASRLLLIHGDQGPAALLLASLAPQLPKAVAVTLPGYALLPWSDFLRDNAQAVGAAMSELLSHASQNFSPAEVTVAPGEGEVAGVFYRVEGSGPPLVLLPLMLAPSQWDPLLPQLSRRYCVVTLGGAHLGGVRWMEGRADSPSYIGMVTDLVDAAHLRPGQRLLEVGCGSGAVLRRVAKHAGGANPLTGVDLNRYLLREAAGLVHRDGLDAIVELKEGDAEALPFEDGAFDLVLSSTVMEEVDADRMMAELVRVTKPGGKVAVIVRALDIPFWLDVPAAPELQAKVAALPLCGGSVPGGCADASLYRRFRQADLREVRIQPQLASFGPGPVLHGILQAISNVVSPDEAARYQAAVGRAQADGTLVVSLPHHTAIGTKGTRN